jgi:RNA polymerase sigma-70 factor (sigma-E family)
MIAVPGSPRQGPGRSARPGTAAMPRDGSSGKDGALAGNGRDDPGSPCDRPGGDWPAARVPAAGIRAAQCQADRSLRPDATAGPACAVRCAGLTAGEPGPAGPRALHEAGTRPADAAPGPVPAGARSDAGQAITAIYGAQYCSLVRLAAVLVGDAGTAEEVVQDSFIALCGAWSRLRDRGKALAYLRQSVVNRSRSALRHQMVAARIAPRPEPGMPGAEQGAITQLERSAVISAMRTLSARQREALVLRFYLDLSERQAASAMGISPGAVKYHTARAKNALRNVL